MRRVLLGLVAVIVVAVVGLAIYLTVAPPELLRVADNYAAKIVCSNVFLAGRDPEQVLALDVQAPGNPVLKLVRLSVDKNAGTVTARMLGLFATGTALYRPGLGCAAVPDGDLARAEAIQASIVEPAPLSDAPWPAGDGASPADPRLATILGDAKLVGPEMRAVVVVKDGQIVGEAYGPGFSATTPLIGWSMTKTVNAVLLGMAIGDGKLGLDDTGLFPGWRDDDRKAVTLRSMLAMTPGLSFNEDYGDVTDVTRMLYLEPDMTGFAARQPLVAPPGTKFNYATGTAVMLAKIWMQAVGGGPAGLKFPRERLFGPLGMTSAVFEPDEAGTLVGGSYVYASGRDWARIGQFLLQGGQWNGVQLLAPELVAMMHTPNGLPGGYSQFETWIEGPTETDDKSYGLPADTYWLEGHDGQSVAIIPSQKLVVVRLGLTPSDLGWGPEPMVKEIIGALGT